MTQKEIIEREEGNTSFIWLYLEGTFWKAYERSAYAFHSRVKEFRVLRKESKTLGRDILYLGFPQTAFERNTASLLLKSIDEKTVYATLPMYDELSFLLQVLTDAKEVSTNTYAMLSENIQSVSRQLSLLQRKAKADVPAG